MIAKVITPFEGEIGTQYGAISIHNQNLFTSCQWILEHMEDKFDIDIKNHDFLTEFICSISRLAEKTDEWCWSTLENDFYECIEAADTPNDIVWEYCYSGWKLENLNENMKNYKF